MLMKNSRSPHILCLLLVFLAGVPGSAFPAEDDALLKMARGVFETMWRG